MAHNKKAIERQSSVLNSDEWARVFALGYTIRHRWIGPVERWEYRVSLLGNGEVLAFRKSKRAAFNFIIRHAAQQLNEADADPRRKSIVRSRASL